MRFSRLWQKMFARKSSRRGRKSRPCRLRALGAGFESLETRSMLSVAVVGSVSPNVGALSGGSTENVAITGSGFTAATAVDFGSTPATSFTINSDTSISAQYPAGSGTVDVQVVDPDGTSAITTADQFSYLSVTSVSPSNGPITGGQQVIITGNGFTGASQVSFGSTLATSFVVDSNTEITATTPPVTAQVVNVNVINAGVTSSGSVPFTYESPAQLAITSPVQTLTAGVVSSPVTVQLEDAQGTALEAGTGGVVVNLATDPAAVGSFFDATGTTAITTVTIPQGSSTASFTFKGTVAGSTLLSASTTGLLATSQTETVNPAATSTLVVSGFASPTTAGSSGSITVTAEDAFGNTTTGYLGTVQFASSDTQAVLPGNYTFVAGDNGVHTFSGVELKTAGTQSITATDTVTSTVKGSEGSITVNPAAASVLVVSGFPTTVTAGTTEGVTVTAEDPYGNTATGYTGTVQFTSSDAQAVLPGPYTFTAADDGLHGFSSDVELKTAGTQSITATDTVTSTITGSQSGITIDPTAASVLIVSGFPTTVTAGTTSSVNVKVEDAFGNTDTGYTGTVKLSSSDTQATLPAAYTFTAADDGAHTFSSDVELVTAGTQSITAADTSASTVAGSQGAITVNAAAASLLAFSQQPTSAQISVAISPAVTVQVEDAFHNVVTSDTSNVTVALGSNAAGGTLSGTLVEAAVNGVATFSDLSIATLGTGYTLTASDASATVTGATSATFNITPAVPAAPPAPTLAPGSLVAGNTNYVANPNGTYTLTTTLANATPGETAQFAINGGTPIAGVAGSATGQFQVTVPATALQVGSNSITVTATNSNGLSSPASSPLSLTYAPSFNQVYTVPATSGATQTTITVTLDSTEAALHSEVGYFIAQDANGDINGVAPGTPGYSAVAMSHAVTLFTNTAPAGSQTTITVPTGGYLVMYMVQFSSKQAFLAYNPNDLQFPSMWYDVITFFSVDAANPDGMRHVVASGDPTTGNVQYAWEDGWAGGVRDYNDAVISLAPVQNAGQAGAALRVPGSTTDTHTLTATLDASQKAYGGGAGMSTLPGDFGVYYVNGPAGGVYDATSKTMVYPGNPEYAQDALAAGNFESLFDAGASIDSLQSSPIQVSGSGAPSGLANYSNAYLAFYSISSGSTANFLTANPTNSSSGGPAAFFSFDAASADDANHFRWYGAKGTSLPLSAVSNSQTLLHVMDQIFGTEADFDDFMVSLNLN